MVVKQLAASIVAMAGVIETFVAGRPHATFAEIMQLFDEADNPIRGNYAISSTLFPNIIYWCGLSEDAVAAFGLLFEEERLFVDTTAVLTYMIDGELLKFPIAKSWRHYKKPRWRPVTMNTTEGWSLSSNPKDGDKRHNKDMKRHNRTAVV